MAQSSIPDGELDLILDGELDSIPDDELDFDTDCSNWDIVKEWVRALSKMEVMCYVDA